MERKYEFLCEFTKMRTPTKRVLVKRYGEESLTEALENKWIELFDIDDTGDERFTITEKGIEERDK